MTLDKASRGSLVRIISIDDSDSRSHLLRVGISEGCKVICQEKLPMGPVVLRFKRQEIAIGRRLAKGIHIE